MLNWASRVFCLHALIAIEMLGTQVCDSTSQVFLFCFVFCRGWVLEHSLHWGPQGCTPSTFTGCIISLTMFSLFEELLSCLPRWLQQLNKLMNELSNLHIFASVCNCTSFYSRHPNDVVSHCGLDQHFSKEQWR